MDKDKKIIDDYYSNISQSWTSDGETDENKKKIKLKTKKVVSAPKEKTSQEEIQIVDDAPKPKKIVKKVVQHAITHVEPEEPTKVEEVQEDQESETKEEERKDTPVVKFQSAFKLVEKKDIVAGGGYKSSGISTAEFKRPWAQTATKPGFSKDAFRSRGPVKPLKKAYDENDEGHKKSKLTPLKDKNKRVNIYGDDDDSFSRSHKVNKKKEEKKVEDIKQNLTSREGQLVVIPSVLTIKELSEKIGIGLAPLIAEFLKNGMMVNINSKIDFESASIIAETFQVKLERDKSSGISVKDLFGGNIQDLLKEDDDSKLVVRPPVVSIMGHVDHGKTSLLDYIRKAKVAAGEAGGITQSIWAYQVETNGKKITFLDTPWHEAFTIMRARGARSTDIAILVVAADEGAKPQTIESINHAKEAWVSVIVAINKMDKEGANPDMVKSQLAEHGLIPEDWGGETPMIPVSAKTGFGVDNILDVIHMVAEMKNLRANPLRAGVGTVIESHLDTKLWPVATILVNAGKVQLWDNVVCKDAFGKIKVLKNHLNHSVQYGIPGDPLLVIGLDKVAEGWDIIQVVSTPEMARQKAAEFKEILAQNKWASSSSLEVIMWKIKSGNMKQLKLVVKADTNGSLEAIKWALAKLSTEETQVQVVHSWVGNVTESDVLMCQGSEALLIGFRVNLISNVKNIIEEAGVEFISSEVIYHILEKVEKIITWMLDTKEVQVELGKATVGGIFYTSKEFTIVGLKIKDASIVEKKAKVRVVRDERIVGNGTVDSVKQGIEEVKKFEGPGECGIKFIGNIIPQLWDTLELYKIEIWK